MPKAVRLFLHDNIKFTCSSNVPGTPIETRVQRSQRMNFNVIDLSRRLDIEAVELNLKIKEGTKYDNSAPSLPIPKTEDFKIDDVKTTKDRLSGLPFVGKLFKGKGKI